MFIFFVMSKRVLKRVLLFTLLSFFTAWLLFMQNERYFSVFSQKIGGRSFYKGNDRQNNVALTFNVSWGDELVVSILDVLEKGKVQNATFFLSGAWAERHVDIVERIKRDGHEIGSLGYDYLDYTEIEVSEVKKDLNRAADVFRKLEIDHLALMRTPTENFNKDILQIIHSYGLTAVHWSVNSLDTLATNKNKIIQNVSKQLGNGDIVLLHGSDDALYTKKALPFLLQEVRSRGFRNVSVSELIANADARSKEIH